MRTLIANICRDSPFPCWGDICAVFIPTDFNKCIEEKKYNVFDYLPNTSFLKQSPRSSKFLNSL